MLNLIQHLAGLVSLIQIHHLNNVSARARFRIAVRNDRNNIWSV